MKYLFVCKSLTQKDIDEFNKALKNDDWNYIITNMDVIFEKIGDDIIKIEFIERGK